MLGNTLTASCVKGQRNLAKIAYSAQKRLIAHTVDVVEVEVAVAVVAVEVVEVEDVAVKVEDVVDEDE